MVWQDSYQRQAGATMFNRITPAVRSLLVVTIIAYLIQVLLDAFTRDTFTLLMGLSLGGIKALYLWQLVTYMFLHGSPFHLLVNMMVLFFMGPETERGLGTRHFLVLYFLSGILGGVAWLFTGSLVPCVGASGAIFGVLGAFATLYPHRQITLLLFFIIPITMKAWLMVAGLSLIELVSMVSGRGGNIAYTVHVGGVIVGIIYTWINFRGGGGLHQKWQARQAAQRFTVLQGGAESSPPPKPKTTSEDVDRILDKIAAKGIKSLSREERRILEEASQRGR